MGTKNSGEQRGTVEVNPGTGVVQQAGSPTLSLDSCSAQKPSGWRQTIGIDCGKTVCGRELLRANPSVVTLRRVLLNSPDWPGT